MRIKEPDAFNIMPVDVTFKSDDEFLPLQAADMLVWCFRRYTDRPDEHTFEWLLGELPAVSQAVHCNYYDLERMQSINEESDRLVRNGAIPKELERAYRELFVSPPRR